MIRFEVASLILILEDQVHQNLPLHLFPFPKLWRELSSWLCNQTKNNRLSTFCYVSFSFLFFFLLYTPHLRITRGEIARDDGSSVRHYPPVLTGSRGPPRSSLLTRVPSQTQLNRTCSKGGSFVVPERKLRGGEREEEELVISFVFFFYLFYLFFLFSLCLSPPSIHDAFVTMTIIEGQFHGVEKS